MTNSELRVDPRFAGYQADFFRRIVSEIHPGSLHILIAPIGSGKSFAMVGSIVELMRIGRLKRVLVLVPASLATQWSYLVDDMGGDSVVVDGGAFRLMREKIGGVPSNWPQGVYVMSIDLSKRIDVSDLIGAVDWDAVVVDEAHVLAGQRLEFVRSLAAKDGGPALLLATHTKDVVCEKLGDRGVVIDWNLALKGLGSRSGDLADESLVRVTRIYRRSVEELAVARDVLDTAKALGPLQGMVLLRRASSGIMALEDTLVNWAESPNPPAHCGDEIERLLQAVEKLHVDSKLECFKRLVGELRSSGDRHVVMFCEFRGTLECVAAAVDDVGLQTFVLHGGLSSQRHAEILGAFETQGGLLLTTAGALQGVEIRLVEAVVHYDLPMSPEAFAVRESRYHRYGRKGGCTVYLLQDELGAYPLDALLARLIRSMEFASGDEDVDALFGEALAPRDAN